MKAILRGIHISPLKARRVVDMIRGKSVDQAAKTLRFTEQKAAKIVLKLLSSAVANAENDFSSDIDLLFVEKTYVDEGPRMRRSNPRAKGRGNRITKPTSHITVILSERE